MTSTRRHSAVVLAVAVLACVIGLAGIPSGSATVTEPESAPSGNSAQGAPELPAAGIVRFGSELGGVQIGMTPAQVESVWGVAFGLCRDCPNETRYYTFEPFAPEGAGVEFVDDRVAAAFTLWQPTSWRSAGGLELGTPRDEIPGVYLELAPIECAGYEAFAHVRRDAKTVLYVYDDVLWAYGLMSQEHPVCR